MPARLISFSPRRNPSGSIKWSLVPVATQVRPIFPVLAGISGSSNTTFIITVQSLLSCYPYLILTKAGTVHRSGDGPDNGSPRRPARSAPVRPWPVRSEPPGSPPAPTHRPTPPPRMSRSA